MKAKIRLTKYGTWILINFVFCIIPLIISAVISRSIDDNVITSYISFIYTLLISGVYTYKNSGKENDLILYGVWLLVIFFLVTYILYPKTFSPDIVHFIRFNALTLSLIILIIVLFISLTLNFKNLEEQVERLFNEQIQENANKVQSDVQDIFKKLREEKP